MYYLNPISLPFLGRELMDSLPLNTARPDQNSEMIQLVTFRLFRQTLAIPVEPLFQIIEMVTILPLPKAESPVEGVINVRGKMTPVLDLRRLLRLPVSPYGLHTPILLVKLKNQMTGLIVDEVINVYAVAAHQIAKPGEFLPPQLGELPALQGIVQLAEGAAMLLDLDHLLDPGQELALSRAFEALEKSGAKKLA
jgi:purine-binding chemotaxis protein CheW